MKLLEALLFMKSLKQTRKPKECHNNFLSTPWPKFDGNFKVESRALEICLFYNYNSDWKNKGVQHQALNGREQYECFPLNLDVLLCYIRKIRYIEYSQAKLPTTFLKISTYIPINNIIYFPVSKTVVSRWKDVWFEN